MQYIKFELLSKIVTDVNDHGSYVHNWKCVDNVHLKKKLGLNGIRSRDLYDFFI